MTALWLRIGPERSLQSWKHGLVWTLRLSIYGSCNCERVPREFHSSNRPFTSLIRVLSDPSYPATTPAPNTGTFDMTVICPPFVFGPWVHPLGPSGLASLNDSNCQIRNIVRGDYLSSRLPQSFAPLWVDVRDVALAHVEAALRLGPGPSSNGRYMICSPERFTYHLVGEIIREEFPEWAEEVLPPKEEMPPPKNISLDGIPATRDLGVTYRSFRECIVDLVRQLREQVLREAEADKS